jgi:hypothetical protein
MASLRGQLTALNSRLEAVFQVVHPVQQNQHAYGHEIRNLIILASTEVESHWRAVLKENDFEPSNGRSFTTTDYVRLLAPMKLDEYSVSFPRYPWLEPVSPFKCWDLLKPTQSLDWYDAYNQVKHDREAKFQCAKLAFSIQSVAACAVMFAAQFGFEALDRRFREAFAFKGVPRWMPDEVYTSRFESTGLVWTPVSYQF